MWCAEQGISTKTYYYRLKRVCEAIPEAGKPSVMALPAGEAEPLFAEVTPTGRNGRQSVAVTAQLGSTNVETQNSAQFETIEATLWALSRICSATFNEAEHAA